MPLLSENPMWEAFGQRALLTTGVGGADFGECLATMREVGDGGDADAWHEAWTATGDRLAAAGVEAAGKGHERSAYELYMRASTYHRTAYFPLYGSPVDPRLVSAFDSDTECFRKGAALAPFPIEAIEIEAEFGSMPAYVVRPDDSGAKRPTIVQTNGYDSNIQEMFFSTASAAVSRGYNWIGFDGPGQGRCLIHHGIHLRPDWENVVRPVIDRVLERDYVDRDRVVLVGWSLGGFLAPRAAAFEDRIAALVADPGQWDLGAGSIAMAPISDEDKKRFPDVAPEIFDPMEQWLESQADPFMRWRLSQRGFWVHGVETRPVGSSRLAIAGRTRQGHRAAARCPFPSPAPGSPARSTAGPRRDRRRAVQRGARGLAPWRRSVRPPRPSADGRTGPGSPSDWLRSPWPIQTRSTPGTLQISSAASSPRAVSICGITITSAFAEAIACSVGTVLS